MNNTYNYRSKYDSYESNCTIIKTEENADSASALDALGSLIERLSSQSFVSVIRAIIATLCFFGFIGVIGGVEAETLSIGTGIIFSLFLVFIEILCFCLKKKQNR